MLQNGKLDNKTKIKKKKDRHQIFEHTAAARRSEYSDCVAKIRILKRNPTKKKKFLSKKERETKANLTRD